MSGEPTEELQETGLRVHITTYVVFAVLIISIIALCIASNCKFSLEREIEQLQKENLENL